MTALEVLRQLEALGGALIAKPPDGKLVVRAPKGAVTPELVEKISIHKEELRRLLTLKGRRRYRYAAAVQSLMPATPMSRGHRARGRALDAGLGRHQSGSNFVPRTDSILGGEGRVRRQAGDAGRGAHNCSAINRFGQDPVKYPYCVLNLPAWREKPFDLTLTRWYPRRPRRWRQVTAVEAPPPKPEDRRTCAVFAGGVQVTLRLEANSRWLMWVEHYGTRRRRKDFASPSLDHARRSAEHFYGVPVSGWCEPQEYSETSGVKAKFTSYIATCRPDAGHAARTRQTEGNADSRGKERYERKRH